MFSKKKSTKESSNDAIVLPQKNSSSKSETNILRRGSLKDVAKSGAFSSTKFELKSPKIAWRKSTSEISPMMTHKRMLSKDESFHAGITENGSTHTYSFEEMEAFAQYINFVLKDEELLKEKLPIDPQDLAQACSDGIILCHLINDVAENSIPEKLINRGPDLNIFLMTENCNRVINAVKELKINIVNIGGRDITSAKPTLILAILWQIIKAKVMTQVSLNACPTLWLLKKEDETEEFFGSISVEDILIRWFNHHLYWAGSERQISNFDTDLMDCECYRILLMRLCSGEGLSMLSKSSKMRKELMAEVIIEAARIDLGVQALIRPVHIIQGDNRLNMAFVSQLCKARTKIFDKKSARDGFTSFQAIVRGNNVRKKGVMRKMKLERNERIRIENEKRLKVEAEAKERQAKFEAEQRENERKEREAKEAREKIRIQKEKEAKAEAERLAKIKAEEERLAKLEAERLAKVKAEKERLAKLEAERLAKLEAERLAKLEAERLAKLEAERLAKVEAERLAKLEADRLAKIEAERLAKLEAERIAKVEADKKAEKERFVIVEADNKDESEKLAKIEADKKAETERLAKVEADKKAEKERLAKVEAERMAKIEAERLANIKADEKIRNERLAKIENERKQLEVEKKHVAIADKNADEKRMAKMARDKVHSQKQAQIEAEIKAEADRMVKAEKDKAEAEKIAEIEIIRAKEQMVKYEAERKLTFETRRAEAEKKAKLQAEQLERQKTEKKAENGSC